MAAQRAQVVAAHVTAVAAQQAAAHKSAQEEQARAEERWTAMLSAQAQVAGSARGVGSRHVEVAATAPASVVAPISFSEHAARREKEIAAAAEAVAVATSSGMTTRREHTPRAEPATPLDVAAARCEAFNPRPFSYMSPLPRQGQQPYRIRKMRGVRVKMFVTRGGHVQVKLPTLYFDALYGDFRYRGL